MSIINIDYIRGFVDGEGYLGIMKWKRSEKYTYYVPIVKIAQTEKNITVLNEIKHFLCGGYMDFQQREGDNHDNYFCLVFKGIKNVKYFINKISKLYIKQPQLEILKEFCNMSHNIKERKTMRYREAELYEMIINLNKRGKCGAVVTTK